MRVVSNSSPLVALARIGQLSLLRELYTEIHIPEAVWREVVIEGRGYPGAAMVQQADWIKRMQVSDLSLVGQLKQNLGSGESEAIVLATEISADLVILDERLARQSALNLALRVIGVLGLLLEAKLRGLLPAVKPILQDLQNLAKFYISPSLLFDVLKRAVEQ